MEIGPKDMESSQVVTVCRDTGVKKPIKIESAVETIRTLLDDMQKRMFEKWVSTATFYWEWLYLYTCIKEQGITLFLSLPKLYLCDLHHSFTLHPVGIFATILPSHRDFSHPITSHRNLSHHTASLKMFSHLIWIHITSCGCCRVGWYTGYTIISQ